MKRSLAVACAAVALTSGSAFAQTKYDVTIGGDAFFQAGFVDQKLDDGLRSTEMRNRFRLVLTPSAKADNGLEYGARLRIRADTGSPNTTGGRKLTQDRAYIFAKGGFGTLQAGTINGLSDEYGFIGPNVEGISGSADNTDVDFLNGSRLYDGVIGRSTNFRNQVSGDAASRIIYLTPTFAGFQGGISYMPRNDDSQNSINRQKYSRVIDPGQFAPSFQDVVEFGGLYTGAVGPVTLEASAYYETGSPTKEALAGFSNSFKTLNSYNVAANIGFADFKVGAMYRDAGKSGYCKAGCGGSGSKTWIVGANYTMGPVILAINYQNYKDGGDDLLDPGNANMDLYQAGVTYTVAPGFTTGLEYSYFKANNKDSLDRVTDKGSIILFDTRLAF